MSPIDLSAFVVFCSPRNGRSSPRSPGRLMIDSDLTIAQQLPETDLPLGDSVQRLTPPIPDALITASSCSSCWVQFSQTDEEYVKGLVAKLLQCFYSPHPPEHIVSDQFPIPLSTFAAVEKELTNSHVQEAFDRAVLDTINSRLIEIYKCLGRLDVTFLCMIQLS